MLREIENERVTYDQLTPKLVSRRDYALRTRRLREGATCTITYEAANELAPEVPSECVRISQLHGEWRLTPTADGRTRITHVNFVDPSGAVPPFLAEGPRRDIYKRWILRIARGVVAQAPALPAPAP